MINTISPLHQRQIPSFKGQTEDKSDNPYTNQFATADVGMPTIALYKHFQNKKQGKEDDPTTKNCMQYLTSPKRLLKSIGYGATLLFGTAIATKYKHPEQLILPTLLGSPIFLHFGTVASSVSTEKYIESGKSRGLWSIDFLPEAFHRLFGDKNAPKEAGNVSNQWDNVHF